jgi:hypothetical protein
MISGADFFLGLLLSEAEKLGQPGDPVRKWGYDPNMNCTLGRQQKTCTATHNDGISPGRDDKEEIDQDTGVLRWPTLFAELLPLPGEPFPAGRE